jgi:hypothetical protein
MKKFMVLAMGMVVVCGVARAEKTTFFKKAGWMFGKHFLVDENDLKSECEKVAHLQSVQKDDRFAHAPSIYKLGIKKYIDAEFNHVLARKIAHVKFLKALENAVNNDPAAIAARAEYEKACEEPASEQK